MNFLLAMCVIPKLWLLRLPVVMEMLAMGRGPIADVAASRHDKKLWPRMWVPDGRRRQSRELQ